jgi:KDO2-lipid IV(A) lauroyltransferase
MAEYLLVILAYLAIRWLPHKLLFKISSFCGFFLYMLPSVRCIAKANLNIFLPEKTEREISSIARESVSNIVLSVMELFWFGGRPDKIRKYLDFDPAISREWESCVKDGRGLIYVCMHFGNWELAGLMIRTFINDKFAVIARTVRNPMLDALINESRCTGGNRVIPAKGAVKAMMKALKDGYALATLVDQNTRVRDGGIFVDFLGLPVPVSRVPALFGRKMNASVVVCGCMRVGRRYKSYFEKLQREAGDYADDLEMTQDLMRIVEGIIRKNPEQYLWFYKRFQNIPIDASEELRKKYPHYAKLTSDRFYNKAHAQRRSNAQENPAADNM